MYQPAVLGTTIVAGTAAATGGAGLAATGIAAGVYLLLSLSLLVVGIVLRHIGMRTPAVDVRTRLGE
jgi:hypothetical protein